MDPTTDDIKQCFLHTPLLRNCLDGWIMRDDPAADWWEVALLRPNSVLGPEVKRIEYKPAEISLVDSLSEKVGDFPFFETWLAPSSGNGFAIFEQDRLLMIRKVEKTGRLSIREGVRRPLG